MSRVRSSVDRAATLHRQAVATADAAAAALELFTPSVSPPSFTAKQRALTASLAELAHAIAPGWLSASLDGAAPAPTGTNAESAVAVRVGVASPLPDARFPVLVPLLGVGHLAVDCDPIDPGLLRSVLLRLVAATTPGALRVRAVDPTGVAFTQFAALGDGRVMPPAATDLAGLRAVLSEGEQWVRTPAPAGRHLLILVAGLPDQTDAADLARIAALAAQGPANRLHLIIAGWPATDPQRGPTLPELAHTTLIEVKAGGTIVHDPPDGSFGVDHAVNAPVQLDGDPSATLIEEVASQVAALAKAAATLRLTDLLPSQTWQEESTTGVSTTIGLTGHAPLSLQLGDLAPHWLIGGRSGAGKTAFLVNVLYGLCSRYAPDELTLYLLEFTDHSTFREFTPDERDPAWMPHARAVGIESDRAYGLAVLRELDAEMTRRAEMFEKAGVAKFGELRATVKIPRVVCVIDEFHALVGGDDRVAREAVTRLESVARKGRTYGVHLILASRTVRGVETLHDRRDSAFGQFAVRIALPGGGAVLDVRNSAAASLRLGTAVVNTAGGLGGPTGASRAHERLVDFPDPHAEPKTLATLRRRLWLVRPAGAIPPHIFRGYAPAAPLARWPTTRPAAAFLGRVIDVHLTPASFAFDRTPGRHLAVIGSSGADLLDSATRSLAAQHPAGQARFVVATMAAGEERSGALVEHLKHAGHEVDVVDGPGLRARLEDRALADTYVVGFGMDGLGADLRRMLRDGPTAGAHLIGWWRGLRRFDEDTGGRDDMAGTVLLDVPAAEVTRFLGEMDVDWEPQPFRALLHDRHESRTEVFVPFAAVADE